MSHIDEARLHEYLDFLERGQEGQRGQEEQRGRAAEAAERQRIEQHLPECAECSALLEEVQLIRERASALLKDAAPTSVSMPPFEEIQARARAVGRKVSRPVPRRVFTMNRLTALGWAATIVLAVGVGWLARGSFFGSSQTGEIGQRDDEVFDLPVAQAAASGAEEADHGAQAEPAPSQEARRRSVPEPAEEQIAPAVAADERLEMAAVPPPEPARTDVLAEPPIDVQRPTAAKADAQRDAATRQAVAGVAAEAEQPEAPGRGVAPDARAQLNEAFARTTWSVADRADAERHLGGELRLVEGLPIDSIRVGEVNGRPAVILGQSLPNGEPLEIVQWRPGDAEQPAEGLVAVGAVSANQAPVVRAEERASGEPVDLVSLVAVRNEFVLTLRARVSPDSLAALAGRIRP